MGKSLNDPVHFENSDNFLREVLPLLGRFEILPRQSFIHVGEKEEVRVLRQHVDHAMNILLQGLRDLGHLLYLAAQRKKKFLEDLEKIRFLISAIMNLTEALNTLRLEIN
jgi:hypothetical protein